MRYFRRRYFALAGAAAVVAGGIAFAAPTAYAATTVTATTQITGRPDSGYATQMVNTDNTWATDDMTRTASVTLVGSHSGAECGGISPCYQYTGSVQDTSGAFTTVTGGVSPNAGDTLVNPPVKGTFTGGALDFTFYANSNAPASRLPDSASGTSPIGTTSWLTLMFPPGTQFAGANPNTAAPGDTNVSDGILLPNWSWTYKDVFCEQWVDAFNVPRASSGDITGADHCADTVTVTNPGSQSWTVGIPVSLQIHASTSDPNAHISSYSAANLPAGLSIDTSTGLISGTPTTASNFSATVTAMSSRGHSDSATFAWTVQAQTTPPPPPTFGPGQVSTFVNHSASCLDNRNGVWQAYNPLQLWTCGAAGGKNQLLKAVPVTGGYELQFVTSASTSKWCVTETTPGASGGRLVVGLCAEAPRQVLTLTGGAGACKCGVFYRFADGLAINDKAFDVSNGAAVIGWTFNGAINEAWSRP